MATVTLRRITDDGARVRAAIRIPEEQQAHVASVETSLREVSDDPALTAYAVFDGRQVGLEVPDEEPLGFAVLEVRGGVGFVLRMVVDADHQGRGHGRALLVELVRRLRLDPDVELVATSHREDNTVMAALCASVGFGPWATPFDPPAGEVYLALPR
jgi:diamine N-acetyltransferase